MLVVANGAYKSGSTWLFRVMHDLTGFKLPPEKFHRAGWAGTGVEPKVLKSFLHEVDYANENYIFKAHTFFQRHLLVNKPNVRVLNVTRDLRDVVVSAFHYERMKGRFEGTDFLKYYWSQGRHVAHYVVHYNGLWAAAKNAYSASYEALLSDFNNEVRKVCAFLNFEVTDADLDRVREANTIDQMRAKYNEVSADGQMQFYRKGTAGDWESHFDEASLADVEKIQRRHRHYPNFLDLAIHRWRSWREENGE